MMGATRYLPLPLSPDYYLHTRAAHTAPGVFFLFVEALFGVSGGLRLSTACFP